MMAYEQGANASVGRDGGERSNRYDLNGRVALVAGGLGELGQAVTSAFLAAGATVVIAGRQERPDALDMLRAASATGGATEERVTFQRADVTDEAQVVALVGSVVERWKRLDILANLVGGWRAGEPVTETPLDVWNAMLDGNALAAFLLAKHAARAMATYGGWGRIIHVSSRGARSGRSNAAAYAVAKEAVLTLTEAQAEELRDTAITVNAILPSIIDTAANRNAMPDADRRGWTRAEEIARVMTFLASDDARLISGATIPVYGRA